MGASAPKLTELTYCTHRAKLTMKLRHFQRGIRMEPRTALVAHVKAVKANPTFLYTSVFEPIFS